ncbi:MAG: hypothetical protein LBC12_07695 [Nitrososphaerota archaeon]|jgi:hypothetical protein|nr:hypothetical protein [Nitrososphaerota archaeon]
MSTLVKLHVIRIGNLERNVIQLMWEGDKPPGTPVLIWDGICQTYGIEFSAYPKKDQTEELSKENKYKCALTRLVKARLIKPETIPTSTNKFPRLSPKGHGYNYYSLTALGRLVAEELQQPDPKQVLFLKELDNLKTALGWLRALGHVKVTAEQILDALWQLSKQSFVDKAEFNRYWNGTKLGRMLQNCGMVKRARVGMKDRRRKYFLV